MCYTSLLSIKDGKTTTKNFKSSSSELEDMEDVLLHLSDQDYFSPISVSNQITATLEVTPVRLDGKRSKERQCDIIMKKANKVRDAFLQLHQPLIGEELIRASSEQINDSNNYPYEDYKQQMEELRNRCEELKNKKNAVADIILE
jgi:hypothetical protein